MANVPNGLYGPGMVKPDGTLAKALADYVASLAGGVETATTTAIAAGSAVAAIPPPISITGSGVAGSAEGGYVITAGESIARVAARVAYGV